MPTSRTPCPVEGCKNEHEHYQVLCERCFGKLRRETQERLAAAKAAVRKFRRIARRSNTVIPSEVTRELFQAENAAVEEACS